MNGDISDILILVKATTNMRKMKKSDDELAAVTVSAVCEEPRRRKGVQMCPTLRRKLVKLKKLNLTTHRYDDVREEWRVEACGVPMFDGEQTCRGCQEGWTDPENYPVVCDGCGRPPGKSGLMQAENWPGIPVGGNPHHTRAAWLCSNCKEQK